MLGTRPPNMQIQVYLQPIMDVAALAVVEIRGGHGRRRVEQAQEDVDGAELQVLG